MDVIVTHVNADFDGLGSMVGASCVYPGAAMVLPGGEFPGVRDFLTLHGELLPVLTPADIDPAAITRLIVVDTGARRRLGAAGAWLDLPEVEVHLYDHHIGAKEDIPASVRRVEPRGAVSTVLCAELQVRSLTPTPVQATAMLLGIYEDTGALSYAGTQPEDLEAAAWLLRQGADLEAVSRFSRYSLNPGQRRLLHALLDDLEVREIRGVSVAIACAEEQPYVEDAALLANRLLDVEGVDAAIVLAPMAGKLYAIARSRPGGVDVGAALRELGGGGHARAASATVRDAAPHELRSRLWELLPAFVRAEPVASEIMSAPARTVPPDAPIGEARRLMVRYGHSGLVVTESGKLVGIVTRRDVDRAHHHQLEHAPVEGIMTRRVHTAELGATLSQLEHQMISAAVGRLPVVRNGALVGIVTRTDVLRARHGPAYLAGAPRARRDDSRDNLAVLLRSRFPAGRQRLLELVGKLAAGEGSHAFLVGGIVRDLLLDVPGADVDILVEPDALALARRLAAETGGTWKDKRFGTARVLLPAGSAFDGCGSEGEEVEFATARTESYAHPGALPDVEPSSVSDDLRRRDFTVNAMAVALRPEEFGRLLDPFRGQEDLDRRQLRVLHNLSFLEDPTRLFRAVRFEERFHFEMEPHTEALARRAIADGHLSRISSERLREEFYRTFRETKAIGCLFRLQEAGVLQWLAAGLVLDVPLLQRLPGAREWWENHRGDVVSAPLVYLAGMLAPLGVSAALQVTADRFRLPPPDARRLEAALRAGELGDRLLPPDGTPSVLFRVLQAYPPEALVFARASAAAGEDGKRLNEVLEQYLTEWRHVRLTISGNDLLEQGYPAGPGFGEALERAFAARLDGKIQDREGELATGCAVLDALSSRGQKEFTLMAVSYQEWFMIVLALLIAIPIHEFAHALSAVLLGDEGPRRDGRLSISPLDHFDAFGAFFCLVSAAVGFGIGWGGPYLVNPNALKNRKWDMCQIAAWGPLANLLLAILFAIPLRYHLVGTGGLEDLLNVCMEVNLGLLLFNLLPIGPLDGAKIVVAFLPEAQAYAFSRFQAQWGMWILFGLILLGDRVLGLLIMIPEDRLARLLLGGG